MAIIMPHLWFHHEAEEARDFYLSVFRNAEAGSTVNLPGADAFSFELEGLPFIAINAGSHPGYTESLSLLISTRDQAETDYYWNALTADGGEEHPCGWLKDRFGVWWQVSPAVLLRLLADPDKEKSRRVQQAFYSMKKVVIADLENAYAGEKAAA